MTGSPPSHFFPPHTTIVRGQRVTEMAAGSAAVTEIQLHAAKGLGPDNFAQPSIKLFCFAYMFAVLVRSM